MAGKRGGVRPNAGRPPKASEVKLIEKLSPLDDMAFKQLEQGLKGGEFAYVKLFFEYRFSKPQEKVDVTSLGEALNTIRVIRE